MQKGLLEDEKVEPQTAGSGFWTSKQVEGFGARGDGFECCAGLGCRLSHSLRKR